MLHALRSLVVLLILFGAAASAAETKPFAREDMAGDAVRLTETLRLATAAIGAQVKGKTPQQLLSEAARAVSGGDFAAPRSLPARRSPPPPRTPPTGLPTPELRVRPKTRRQTTATTSSPEGRPRLMPPISIRPRPMRRPQRSLCSPICSRATSSGVLRSTL